MDIKAEYFEWLYTSVGCKEHKRLLHWLFRTPFRAVHKMDKNRISDGLKLREEFIENTNWSIDDMLHAFKSFKSCSILELMIALAKRIESDMSDPDYGDRTVIWFWEMIKSLGLYEMTDENYDQSYTQVTVDTFLKKEYGADGKGSLFTIKNPDIDVRTLDIWYQMSLYINRILGL